MGGGHLSRPDFGMPQPAPDHPLTEFYLLLQHGLDKAGGVPPACALCQLPGTGPAHLCRRGRRVPHPQRNGG